MFEKIKIFSQNVKLNEQSNSSAQEIIIHCENKDKNAVSILHYENNISS